MKKPYIQELIADFKKEFDFVFTPNSDLRLVDEGQTNRMSTFLASKAEELYQKGRADEKANIEQHMVYLFRQLPDWFVKRPRYMSEEKRNSLWSNMCMWTDEYLKKLKENT